MNPPDHALAKDVGTRLREALKMQLTIIHERVEAKKIAKMALAEVRNILAKEEENKLMDERRVEVQSKAWERVERHFKDEGMWMEGDVERNRNGTKFEKGEFMAREMKKPSNDEGSENKKEVKLLVTTESNVKEFEGEVKRGKSKGPSKSRKKSVKTSG